MIKTQREEFRLKNHKIYLSLMEWHYSEIKIISLSLLYGYSVHEHVNVPVMFKLSTRVQQQTNMLLKRYEDAKKVGMHTNSVPD